MYPRAVDSGFRHLPAISNVIGLMLVDSGGSFQRKLGRVMQLSFWKPRAWPSCGPCGDWKWANPNMRHDCLAVDFYEGTYQVMAMVSGPFANGSKSSFHRAPLACKTFLYHQHLLLPSRLISGTNTGCLIDWAPPLISGLVHSSARCCSDGVVALIIESRQQQAGGGIIILMWHSICHAARISLWGGRRRDM